MAFLWLLFLSTSLNGQLALEIKSAVLKQCELGG